jgi:hypothetical protein
MMTTRSWLASPLRRFAGTAVMIGVGRRTRKKVAGARSNSPLSPAQRGRGAGGEGGGGPPPSGASSMPFEAL